MNYIPNVDEIIQDEVYFYAHTVLRSGLHAGAWYKVGTSKNVGDINNIMFSLFTEGNFSGDAGTGTEVNPKVWTV